MKAWLVSALSLPGTATRAHRGLTGLLVTAAIIVSGFFVSNSALAATITPASGGESVSIDTTKEGGTGAYTELSGPSISESVPGDIAVGTHVITLPSGWEFDTQTAVTVVKTAGNILPASQGAILTANTLTFSINSASTNNSSLAFILGSARVRPTGTSIVTGNMKYSGSGIAGILSDTSLGFLSTTPGVVTQLSFETQPVGGIYGDALSTHPVVVTKDKFGNNSTNGLPSNAEVILTLVGEGGAIVGTAISNVSDGIADFSGLKVNKVGTYQLKADYGSISVTSNQFTIAPRAIIAIITASGKTYNGNNTASFTAPTVTNGAFDDVLTLTDGAATFDTANAGANKTVTAIGLVLGGTNKDNYTFDGTATGTANINPLVVTVTPTAGQSKIYGNSDPVFAYGYTSLVGTDLISGSLGRASGDNIGNYAYTLGTLSAGGNYSLSLDTSSPTFEIKKRDLNVTAAGVSRPYNGTDSAQVTFSSNKLANDDVTITGTATFSNKDVGPGKLITVSNIEISGPAAGNYNLTNAVATATADITAVPLTVSFTVNDKFYDGSRAATITGRTATGMVSGETVDVNGGTAVFNDKNVGPGKTVTGTGFTLGGTDAENYVIGSVIPTTANISARPITVTAVTDTKIYDGGPSSSKIPEITSTLQPAIVGNDEPSFSQTFDSKNVGTRTLAPSGIVNDDNIGNNYTVTFGNATGTVNAKTVTVTAVADTKTYDGDTSSSKVPTIEGLVGGDTVTTNPSQVYDTKNVGTIKALAPSGLVISDGNSGNNYTPAYVSSTAGVITTKNLTVSNATTNSKIYDGMPNATVNFTGASLNGVVDLDNVSLKSVVDYTAAFDNENVGANKTVTVSGLTLDGVGADNYSLTQPTLADGVITVKSLTVTATGVSKTYNGTDVAMVNLLSTDKLDGDDVVFNYASASFADEIVGDGKQVSVSGISISGNDAGNYTLANTAATTTANINQAPLTATITVADKVVDGNTAATITGRELHGLISGDDVSVSGGTADFIDATVGNNKDVNATGLAISGTDAGNYSFDQTATGRGNILPIPTVVSIDDGYTIGNVPLGHTLGYNAFASIQEGVDAVDVNGTVNVAAGTYTGNVNITKSLTLQGVLGANIVGQVVISNDGVTIDGLGISNPAGNFGIVATDVSNITLTDNAISNIGTSLASGSAQAIGIMSIANDISGITIGGNAISNIGNASMLHGGSAGSSAKGIYLGNSGGLKDISGVLISNNAISSVYASGNAWVSGGGGGAGAYGILINHSTGSIGKTISPNVSNNTISGLNGLWSHGIGLEGNTPGAIVTGNTVSGLASSKTPSDAVAVMVEANAGADSVNISQNKLDANFSVMNTVSGKMVKAEGNWWGTADNAAIAAKFSGLVDYRPWYTTDTLTGLDSTSPTVTVSSATTSPTNATSIPVTITFSESVTGFTADDIIVTNGVKGNFSGSGAVYTIDITPTVNSTVTAAITADTAEDLSGNYNLAAIDFSIVSDTDAPTATLNGMPTGTVNEITATIAVSGSGVTHYKYKLDNDSYGNETAVSTPISLSGLIDGSHTILVIGRDAAGNYQAEAGATAVTWTIDATDPALPVISSIGGTDNKISNVEKAAIVVIGTAEAGSTVSVSLTGGLVAVTETGTADGSGNYSIVIDGSTLPDGVITPSVVATDATGNASASAAAPTAIKDVSAPSVTDKAPSVNAVGIAPSANMTIAFSENVVITGANVTITGNPAKNVTFDSNANVATIDPTDNLANNTTYTVTLTGVTDLAGNALPTMSWSFTTAASYSIPLTLGWNLISLPVVPTNTVASAVLGSLNDLSKIQSVFTYDAVNGQWLVYHPGSPETSSFSTMTAGTGYWINYLGSAIASLSGTGNLFLEGNNTPPQKELSPGWNLIGYFQLENTISATAANALSTVAGQWTQLRTYNNATKQFQAVGATDMMQPGQGFWIFMKSSSYAPYLYGPGDGN